LILISNPAKFLHSEEFIAHKFDCVQVVTVHAVSNTY